MIKLKVALPPEWADEQQIIDSTLRGRIKRNVGDECEIEFVLTNDYGRFRLIESLPDSILRPVLDRD